MNSSSKKLTSKDCELVSYGLSRWLRTESPRGKTLKGNQWIKAHISVKTSPLDAITMKFT